MECSNGILTLKGDSDYYNKHFYEIDPNKKYKISFDFKRGNSQTTTGSTLFFRCYDGNKNFIEECDVKELTTPTKVLSISYYRKSFVIDNVEGILTGDNQCIAFNKQKEINTLTQTLLFDVNIVSIVNTNDNKYEIKINKNIPYTVSINDFVSLHSNKQTCYGLYSPAPTDSYQTFSYTKQGLANTTGDDNKFPVCTRFCRVYIRSHPTGKYEEVTHYKNIFLEEVK